MRESTADGYAIIKATVSGHRKFPLQVVARSFVPTKFNLPAGWWMLLMPIFICSFAPQQLVKISRLENTNCISQSVLMWLQSRSQYITTTLLRAPKHLQSICTYHNTTERDTWIMVTPSLLKSSLTMVSNNLKPCMNLHGNTLSNSYTT